MAKRLKFFIYDLVLFLAKLRKTKKSTNKLLVVKTDEIGDYILWRNFIPYFRSCERFKDYSITLCGNQSWKNLTEKFDKDFFNDFLWLDKKKFKSNMLYRYRFLKKVNRSGFDIVINTIFSRSLRPDDSIIKAACARLNIGMISDESNIESFEKGYDQQLYQELVDIPFPYLFDFFKNKIFTEKITGLHNLTVRFGFDTGLFKRPLLPENYFIIFPGSNNPKRIWLTSNFIDAAIFLHEEYGYHAVVCGSPSDKPYTDAFIKEYPHSCTNLTGKTSLYDFLEVLAFSKCIISIDTGSVHLAAAVQCPVYGIFNGSRYGRFAPYPKEVSKTFHAIYPDSVDEEVRNDSIVSKYRYLSQKGYNEVSSSKVIHIIKDTLPKEKPIN